MSKHSTNQGESQLRPGLSGLRYLAELAVGILLFCITLHTFFLAGLIVPVTVSGGSMAKTILGPRREVRCHNCGIIIACGHERLPTHSAGYCLNCGASNVNLDTGRDYPGERAVIDRASLSLNPPHRWEVIVFRCPDNPDQFCIKRVVGLQGEEILLHSGDVFVNGEIARKSANECRDVAQLVHDAEHESSEYLKEGSALPWRPKASNKYWAHNSRSEWEYRVPEDEETPPEMQWLEFDPIGKNGLVDDYDYNQSESRRLNLVTDLMLRCEIILVEADMFSIRSEVMDDPFELVFLKQDHRIQLKRGGKVVSEGRFPLRSNVFEFEVIRFDRQFLVSIDRRLVLSHRFEPDLKSNIPTDQASPAPPWAIGMRSGKLNVEKLQVLRDIYYTVPTASRYAWGSAGPVKLAEDEYFVLGDNSPISADSRIWRQPGISRNSLVGRLLGSW